LEGLKRHVVRMMDGLALVEATMARKVEGYARFGLGLPEE
jgi:hypothetical protein